MLENISKKITIFGRAWVYDEDPNEIEVWVQEIEPMDSRDCSGAEWCREHFRECYGDEELRVLLKVPSKGNFQVLFSGVLEGYMSGWESPEWDEEFTLNESKCETIPAEFMAMRADG